MNEIVNQKNSAIVHTETAIHTLTPVDNVEQQFKMVHDLYERIMIKDEHYGIIPGTKKDTLYKAGAEKLCLMFKLVPKIDNKIERELINNHKEIEITIGLYHRDTGLLWGQGIGSCSTMETKFRYREGKRLCPKCGKDSIIKGKEEYGGGWLCYKKTGGCGEKFIDNDTSITNQQVGRIENTDIADIYNTVLKMAYKRALVSATITATGVSDIFTQDVEDFVKDKYTEIVDDKVKKEFNGTELPTVEVMKMKTANLTEYSVKYFRELKYTLPEVYEWCKPHNFDADKIEKAIKEL